MNDFKSFKARITKASRLLQAKVGTGKVSEDKISESQDVIDDFDSEFEEYVLEHLEGMDKALAAMQAALKKGETPGQDFIDQMIGPVMELKGNASMFNYELVGNLANTILNFLEALEHVDKDVIDILEIHNKTARMILTNHIQGDGGEYGEELRRETKDACKRYFAKQAKGLDFAAEDHGDIFFVE